MSAPSWSDLETLFHEALAYPPADRAAFLAERCAGRPGLQADVEALLRAHDNAPSALDLPPVTPQPQLRSGARLGPYEVVAVLGAGGMGEVYRARDTELGRDVALKILPTIFTNDPERRARFEREAQVLAALNHPHIGAIYGFEHSGAVRALVLELIEGPTLADRISKAPLPVTEALGIARQITEALEAAHEKGIIHRDLKPANIKITPDGTVKVLDFGLAKVAPGNGLEPDGALVMMTTTEWRPGAIIGTPPYMSPEQASGKPVDKRTDIWSFGVVMWELLTGRRLFERDTTAETLSNVKTAVIDLQRLPGETPIAIRDLLARCLDRDPRTRLRDIGEARIQIQRVLAGTPKLARFPTERLLRAATWVSTSLAVLFAVAFAIERRAAQAVHVPLPLTFHIPAPPQTTLGSGPALSPDGRHVAFTARSADGRVRIWVHSFDSGDAHPLVGTEDAFSPLFWSPDSRFIGFATGMTLSKIRVAGGRPVALCDRCGPASIGSRVFRGGAWSSDGVIVYAISSNGLWRVPDTGGVPVRVSPAGNYGYPAFLPDGAHILYTRFGSDPQPGVYIGDARQHEQRPSKRLIDGAFVLSGYVPRDRAAGGYLLALREGVLTARSFDPVTATVSGEPVVMAQEVPTVDPPAAFSAPSSRVPRSTGSRCRSRGCCSARSSTAG
jgi:serine/threonine protein kinase